MTDHPSSSMADPHSPTAADGTSSSMTDTTSLSETKPLSPLITALPDPAIIYEPTSVTDWSSNPQTENLVSSVTEPQGSSNIDDLSIPKIMSGVLAETAHSNSSVARPDTPTTVEHPSPSTSDTTSLSKRDETTTTIEHPSPSTTDTAGLSKRDETTTTIEHPSSSTTNTASLSKSHETNTTIKYHGPLTTDTSSLSKKDETITRMTDHPSPANDPISTETYQPRPAKRRAHPPSIMLQKFLGGGEAWESPPDREPEWSKRFPKPYFFYGSLMDPTRLSSVLGLHEKPSLRPATVIGYRLMLWGPYPALVSAAGQEGAKVPGLMYEVQSLGEAAKLQRYETNNYGPKRCTIKLDDGTKLSGDTFMWNADRGTAPLKIFTRLPVGADQVMLTRS